MIRERILGETRWDNLRTESRISRDTNVYLGIYICTNAFYIGFLVDSKKYLVNVKIVGFFYMKENKYMSYSFFR
jgi:hypothetical protein